VIAARKWQHQADLDRSAADLEATTFPRLRAQAMAATTR